MNTLFDYLLARDVRFSCAYLFRIKLRGKYFLVKDEQGRENFQPVGGVYKYTSDEVFEKTNAVQCTRFDCKDDLTNDLRLIIPRKYAPRFRRWYEKGIQRETPDNLYREFEEEVLDRIPQLDRRLFKTISYRFLGTHLEQGRLGENNYQFRYADVVELLPTPEQTAALLALESTAGGVYCFATKEEIYNDGCVNGNQIPNIAHHTRKILEQEQRHLRRTRRSGQKYTTTCDTNMDDNDELTPELEELWEQVPKADISKPFTFISYTSNFSKTVWQFCLDHAEDLPNVWLDRKLTSENWLKNAEKALNSPNCENALLFISKDYMIRSYPCHTEASLIAQNSIPHIVVMMDIDHRNVKNTIKLWIESDLADKNKLRTFKRIFHYDDDTAHINVSSFTMEPKDRHRLLQAFRNLSDDRETTATEP